MGAADDLSLPHKAGAEIVRDAFHAHELREVAARRHATGGNGKFHDDVSFGYRLMGWLWAGPLRCDLPFYSRLIDGGGSQ
jgi:hypothetical protein